MVVSIRQLVLQSVISHLVHVWHITLLFVTPNSTIWCVNDCKLNCRHVLLVKENDRKQTVQALQKKESKLK